MVLSLLEDVLEALGADLEKDPHGRTQIENNLLADLGEALAKRIDRKRPFSHRHLKSILNRTLAAPQEDGDLGRALRAFSQEIDGIPDKLAGAVPVTVFVPPHLAEKINGKTLLTRPPRKCKRPACFVTFVPNAPNQRYHSAACRLLDKGRSNEKSQRQ